MHNDLLVADQYCHNTNKTGKAILIIPLFNKCELCRLWGSFRPKPPYGELSNSKTLMKKICIVKNHLTKSQHRKFHIHRCFTLAFGLPWIVSIAINSGYSHP